MGGAAAGPDRAAGDGPPWAWRLFVGVVVGFLRLFGWRLRVRVVGDVVPSDRAAVVVANHTGNLEPFLVAHVVRQATGHWIQPLVKAELFANPVLAWLAPRAGAIAVHRDTAGGRDEAYVDAIARLRTGGTIYIAPEGTITHDGRLLPLRHGAARLALEAGAPLVVVTTFGGQRAFSPIVRLPHRDVPFDVVIEQVTPLPDEDAASLTGRVAATLLDRTEELRADYPDADPDAPWWPPYSEPAEPSRTGRENLEQYREAMAEQVHRARERMAALTEERDVQARLDAARERARVAADHARERAEVIGAELRLHTDELVELARSGELGGELRHRAEDLAAHVRDIVDHLGHEQAPDTAPDTADDDADDETTGDDAAGEDATGDGRALDPRVASPAPLAEDG